MVTAGELHDLAQMARSRGLRVGTQAWGAWWGVSVDDWGVRVRGDAVLEREAWSP